jgi:putative FmdB family regulatory protein
MPIFEYTCKKCGTEFEELVRSGEEKVECPVCQSSKIEKRLSSFASCGSNNLGYSPLASSCGSSSFG